MKYRELGEIFTNKKGVRLQVVQRTEGCKGCYYKASFGCKTKPCLPVERPDHNDIIFKELLESFNPSENKRYETIDGPIYHSRSIAVVNIVLCVSLKGKGILLTKRSPSMEDEPNKWCFPCGYLNWNETITEAVNRETLEETGLNLSILKDNIYSQKLIQVSSDPKASKRQNVSMVYLTILSTASLPEVKPTEECSEVKWLSPKEINDLGGEMAFGHLQLLSNSADFIKLFREI